MYKLLYWFTLLLPFPHRGWKYLRIFMQKFGLDKRLYKKKIFNGSWMQLMPEDHVQQYLFWYGIYEAETAEVFLQNVQQGTIVLDIGANVGYYSILAASKAINGRVFAFEPNALLHSQIQNSLRFNNFENVQVVAAAVSNKHRQAALLYLSSADNKGMSALATPSNYSGQTTTIETITIDNWVADNNISRVDIIKMDIEGAETLALEGMRNTLIRFSPIVFMEVCDEVLQRQNSSAAAVFNFMSLLNYNAYGIDSARELYLIDNYIPTIDFNIVFKPK